MPATSIRDLVVKDDDVVVGTHGRSFWILDDVTLLRQLGDSSARRELTLYRPQTATRWRWNVNTDTPLPADEPMGENPPDGAVIDYWIGEGMVERGRAAVGDVRVPPIVTLEILDAGGRLVRRYASTDTAMPPADVGNVPAYWIRPTKVLSAEPGMHRFVWDLRWDPPVVQGGGYPIAAIPGNTPREPRGPWVTPGTYTVRLTLGPQAGTPRAVTQPLTVRMDPRVKTPAAALARQLALSLQLREALGRSLEGLRDARGLRARARELAAQSAPDSARRAEFEAFDKRLAAIEGGAGAGDSDSFTRLHGELAQLYGLVQTADLAPTPQVEAAASQKLRALRDVYDRLGRAQHDPFTPAERQRR
jgi:hypothetical protein